MKKTSLLSIMVALMLVLSVVLMQPVCAVESSDYKVNLSDLTKYSVQNQEVELKTYTQEDFETFVTDYKSGTLPKVYVTEFLFDGVGMVKTPDLDDFIESGNDAKVKNLEIKAININTTGTVEFSGEITGGMIAINTNGVNGNINILLNNAKIDTDSKKVPAVYVYNKDITYTGCKVTIKTAENSKNYVEGGKFKKVSLVGSDELSSYSSKYSGDSSTWYSTYTNYYGVYTSSQINDVLFAKVQADNEDLVDGDPYYFYKGAGAISSDIDLYFEGNGYLEVKSKNKEGIETKGNLTLSGGTGDYVVLAEDDCLNTTTKSSAGSNVRNALTVDVKSLVAIVDSGEDSDEGDAIDSNGTLTINGGTILAVAHPGQDAGIDSESGTYINGGTIVATGDMQDPISNESKQNFLALNFRSKPQEGTTICLLDSSDNVVMAYKTDRTYSNLVYSSNDLTEGSYYLYKDGEISGTETNGLYTKVDNYSKGTQLGYSSEGSQMGMPGGNMQDRNEIGKPPAKPDGEEGNTMGERPQMPDGEQGNMIGNPPDMNGEDGNVDSSSLNTEFKVSGISNQYSGIAEYGSAKTSPESSTKNNNNKTFIIIISVLGAAVLVLLVALITAIKKNKK